MASPREIIVGDTFDMKFTTIDSTGLPVTLAGTPAISAYPDNSTTEITAGITLTVDFDTRTGLHNVRVVATVGNGYAADTNYVLVLTAGTVDGVSVVGYVVDHFSTSTVSLKPTTAGRTLDVTAAGTAGIDWGNVENPTTAVDLSATDIQLCDTVTTNTDMRGTDSAATAAELAKVPKSDGTVTWNATALGDINAQCDTALTDYDAVVPADLPTNFGDLAITVTTGEVTVGTNNDKTGYTASTVSDKTGYSLTATTGLGNQTADITGDLSGSVGSVTGAVGSVTGNVDGNVTGSVGSNLELGPTEVNAEVDTALADIGLDHLISSALPTNWATDVASGSVFDNIADDGTAAFDRTTDSLQAVRDHVGDGTNLTEAGGTGDQLTALATATNLATVDTVVNGIQTDLDNGTDGLGALKTLIDAVQTEVNKLTQTAHAEPTGVPAANESPIDKLGYLFMALRNQVDVTATKKTFYDDGGVAEWEKDLSDDGTTYSESEGNAI